MESKDFFWSWSYENHRVRIVLNELEPKRWNVTDTLEYLRNGKCGCSSTLAQIEELTFSSAKEALQAAERLVYRHVDEHRT